MPFKVTYIPRYMYWIRTEILWGMVVWNGWLWDRENENMGGEWMKKSKKICFIYDQIACDRLTLLHITIINSEQNTKNKYL